MFFQQYRNFWLYCTCIYNKHMESPHSRVSICWNSASPKITTPEPEDITVRKKLFGFDCVGEEDGDTNQWSSSSEYFSQSSIENNSGFSEGGNTNMFDENSPHNQVSGMIYVCHVAED